MKKFFGAFGLTILFLSVVFFSVSAQQPPIYPIYWHLHHLADVVLTSLADSDVLVYNATTEEWNNSSVLTSGAFTSTVGYLYNAETTATPSSAFTVDWTAKHVQRVTITGTTLDVTFTDPATPCKLVLVVVQGDGDDTIDWTNEASILWPGAVDPVLSTGSGDIDLITLYFDGTSYLGVANYDFN